MKIVLHIGLEHVGVARMQTLLETQRERLKSKGILVPSTLGGKNHTRLFMSVLDPDHLDPLRMLRGVVTEEQQNAMRSAVIQNLDREVGRFSPKKLILTASQFGTVIHKRSELERLAEICHRYSKDVTIVAHVDEQAALLARHYAFQVKEGRQSSLDKEIALCASDNWWDAALAQRAAENWLFPEIQTPPFWLDYTRLVERWEDVFGQGSVRLRPYRPDHIWTSGLTDEVREAFELPNFGKIKVTPRPTQPSAAWVTRMRLYNKGLNTLIHQGERVDRPLRKSLLEGFEIEGDPQDPAKLSYVSHHFAKDNKALAKIYPNLEPLLTSKPPRKAKWKETDPQYGFRATQYLASQLHRITASTKAHSDRAKEAQTLKLSETAEKMMPPLARQNYLNLRHSQFAPHNNLPPLNEEDLAAPYFEVPRRKLRKSTSGNVIVGCMKNEAPYILEWIAYHRAIGIDNFLIYTNGCEDGTNEILGRLQEMGVLEHRLNEDWKGKSPQQHALNRSLDEPIIQKADWVIHIDVDEFINVRCGNGTLADFFARVPDATNVAMTWRLFGHNGITELKDELIIEQFDTCAPKFCPKPHTAWGFKTMVKNIGAYGKLSCHRPNHLDETNAKRVKWVNGSGKDITKGFRDSGWRSTQSSIGYDLLQLNHYALRSAESFLVKRQRGRALHVDRTVGLNYWIRMDWSVHRDMTIKRNIPRVRAELERLLSDKKLAAHQKAGLQWHRAKIAELHKIPEFEDIYQHALSTNLTELERVAFSLALDMES